ncbi:unnamed protein product [Clavelina lepadiformis]|uniref:Uncharacterized protein n=1 Tax=Clavelina lepadiformis TaxID=159417 RepID=A0ABP0GN27_CLALP
MTWKITEIISKALTASRRPVTSNPLCECEEHSILSQISQSPTDISSSCFQSSVAKDAIVNASKQVIKNSPLCKTVFSSILFFFVNFLPVFGPMLMGTLAPVECASEKNSDSLTTTYSFQKHHVK